MATGFDVAGRLSEGETMLADVERYVAACEALGHRYSGPDLRQLYTAESGLDLHSLEADRRSLSTAADAAEDVLALQDNVSRALAESWSGQAGLSAGDFMRRQSDSARAVIIGLRRTAGALAVLRDGLSRAVDTKVTTMVSLGDSLSGHRQVWTTAALTVLGGGGDRAAASEVVDQQIRPFVDSVVCGEVTSSLRSASNDVVNAYDSVLAAVRTGGVIFEVPGAFGVELGRPLGGESLEPSGYAPGIGNAAALGRTLSVSGAPVVGSAMDPAAPSPMPLPGAAPDAPAAVHPSSWGPPAAPEPVAAAPAPPDSVLPMSATPSPSGDLGIGSAAGGFGRQLADLLGGSLGSSAGMVPDSAGLGGLTDDLRDRLDSVGHDADAGSVDDEESDDDHDTDADKEADDPPGEDGQAQVASDDAAAQAESPEAQPAAAPPPDPVPAATPVGDTLAAEPLAAQDQPISKTPCQIAADELPQVGE